MQANKAKIISTSCLCHNADNVTVFFYNIDKIFKYNHRQTNFPKNIDHTASDAHCIKRYNITVILALQIA